MNAELTQRAAHDGGTHATRRAPCLWSAVRRGSSVGVAAQAAYLVSRFLLTPLIVDKAGLAAYGFWSILFVALGLLGIHRMGLMSASVAHAAAHLGADNVRRAQATLRTTASVALALSLPAAVLIWFQAERGAMLIGIDPSDKWAATVCLRTTGLATLIGLVCGGWQSALEARQQHARVRLTEAGAQMLEAMLLVGMLYAGMGLLGLACAYAVRILVPIPFHIRGARRGPTPLCAWPGRLDKAELGAVLRLGGAVQLLGTVHLAIAAVPRFALAHCGGLVTAGAFEVARKLVEFAAALPAHGIAPLAPAAAALGGRGDEGRCELRRALRTATRLVALVGAIPTALFLANGDDLVLAWLGRPDEDIALVLALLAPAAWFHLTTGPLSAALRGLALPKAELAYAILWLALSVLCVPAAGAQYGLVGVAAAAATTQAICCAGLWRWAPLAREMSVANRVNDVVLPALGPLTAALLVPLALEDGPVAATRMDASMRVLASGALISLGALPYLLVTFGQRPWSATARSTVSVPSVH